MFRDDIFGDSPAGVRKPVSMHNIVSVILYEVLVEFSCTLLCSFPSLCDRIEDLFFLHPFDLLLFGSLCDQFVYRLEVCSFLRALLSCFPIGVGGLIVPLFFLYPLFPINIFFYQKIKIKIMWQVCISFMSDVIHFYIL